MVNSSKDVKKTKMVKKVKVAKKKALKKVQKPKEELIEVELEDLQADKKEKIRQEMTEEE